MPIEIDFIDEHAFIDESVKSLIENIIKKTLEVEKISEPCEVSITMMTNDEIQEINHQYRQKNQATDVISFALEEMGEDEIAYEVEGMPRVLGDILISVERAKEQAEDYGHSFEREIGFLALHGLLHLLGYDHLTEEDERVMFAKQDEVLNALGLRRESDEK